MLTGILVDLVPFGPDFLEKDVEWRNGPSWFWASLGFRGVASKAEVGRRHERWFEEENPDYTGVPFGMRAKDGMPIGFMGMHYVSQHNRLAALGASIWDPQYWGGGFGADGLCLIVEYGFRWLDLHRLELATMSLNERAQRSVEKCGFRLEARSRQAVFADGQYHDELHYGLLRPEWPGYEAMAERLKLRERAADLYGDKVWRIDRVVVSENGDGPA